MIKRLPSAVFVSDVLEYDAVQLRGLAPGYTRVLINGKDVPGAGDDRSFWVDRIPAEMVERIEIIRSGSANRSGDAIAGAINIILRDAYEFDGAYLRVGAMRYDDGEVQPTFGGVASGAALGGRILAGFNVQDRTPRSSAATASTPPTTGTWCPGKTRPTRATARTTRATCPTPPTSARPAGCRSTAST